MKVTKRYDPYKEIGIIELFLGNTAKGEQFYAYISILPKEYDAFLKAKEGNEPFNIMAYGKILERGWGDMPPEDIMQKMQAQYKVDHSLIAQENIEQSS